MHYFTNDLGDALSVVEFDRLAGGTLFALTFDDSDQVRSRLIRIDSLTGAVRVGPVVGVGGASSFEPLPQADRDPAGYGLVRQRLSTETVRMDRTDVTYDGAGLPTPGAAGVAAWLDRTTRWGIPGVL